MTLAGFVADAADRLVRAGHEPAAARRDAVLLARHVLGWTAARWLAHQHEPIPTEFPGPFAALLARRVRYEPIAYVLGAREFYGRSFVVTPDVLIPRPETELLVSEALARVPDRSEARVADVGTGSGCIAVTLALERPAARIVATDTSPEALGVARDNATRWEVDSRIRWHLGSLLADAEGPFDVIVANLPYVATTDRVSLPREVVDHEPETALFAGPDGLDAIGALVPLASQALTSNGWLLLEIGARQADAVRALLARARFGPASVVSDLQGLPRVVAARPGEVARPHV